MTLRGDNLARVRASDRPIARAIVEQSRLWDSRTGRPEEAAALATSVLYDAVAIHLLLGGDLCKIARLPVAVTDDGFTRVQDGAPQMDAALEWKDLSAFERQLTELVVA